MQRVLIYILFLLPFYAFSQEEADTDSLPLPNFKGIRVYKTMSVALQHPDSVIRLDLSKQKLTALSPDIQKLPNLKELTISHNNLKELPEWIGSLSTLEILDCSNNKLSGLPPAVGKLSSLVIFRLNRNVIETLPAEMSKLKKMQVLEMWDNELQTVPYEMRELHETLKVFELRGILFTNDEQKQIQDLLPETQIYFSPTCNCPR